ncbi:MAG: hypothetical protein J6K82_00260, partial [Alphaproteobacteria bacterium]|nr:hypothetical protein [Alphaproteobacteria bacterium]
GHVVRYNGLSGFYHMAYVRPKILHSKSDQYACSDKQPSDKEHEFPASIHHRTHHRRDLRYGDLI